MSEHVRLGVIGAGGIFRRRHFPAFAEMDDVSVEIIANRSVESAHEIAQEFGFDATASDDPDAVVAHENVDAVMVGTWPYKHHEYALAALDAGKHVFVQARMARTYAEAKEMHDAARETDLVTQVCPSPMAMDGDRTMRRLLDEGYVGDVHLIRGHVLSGNGIDPKTPLHWRDVEHYQGVNALQVGILAERLHRWFGHADTISARAQTRILERPLPDEGADAAGGADGDADGDTTTGDERETAPVERPDLISIDCEMANGAFMTLDFCSVAEHSPDNQVEVYGSEGTLVYEFADDTIRGAAVDDDELLEIQIPDEERVEWSVERDFVDAIREGGSPRTTFHEGMKYMEFTEAVFRSVERGEAVNLPLVR
jgi:predicted dehydrogenase